uniref:Uncharacterized protein n=1 Tax=Eutreptiella gymnastica TaxID=73025 RepID=A0A7S4D252_9EUGL
MESPRYRRCVECKETKVKRECFTLDPECWICDECTAPSPAAPKYEAAAREGLTTPPPEAKNEDADESEGWSPGTTQSSELSPEKEAPADAAESPEQETPSATAAQKASSQDSALGAFSGMVIFAMIVAIVIAIVVATVDVDEAAVRARLAKEYKVVQAYSQAMMQRVKDLVAAEPQ